MLPSSHSCFWVSHTSSAYILRRFHQTQTRAVLTPPTPAEETAISPGFLLSSSTFFELIPYLIPFTDKPEISEYTVYSLQFATFGYVLHMTQQCVCSYSAFAVVSAPFSRSCYPCVVACLCALPNSVQHGATINAPPSPPGYVGNASECSGHLLIPLHICTIFDILLDPSCIFQNRSFHCGVQVLHLLVCGVSSSGTKSSLSCLKAFAG